MVLSSARTRFAVAAQCSSLDIDAHERLWSSEAKQPWTNTDWLSLSLLERHRGRWCFWQSIKHVNDPQTSQKDNKEGKLRVDFDPVRQSWCESTCVVSGDNHFWWIIEPLVYDSLSSETSLNTCYCYKAELAQYLISKNNCLVLQASSLGVVPLGEQHGGGLVGIVTSHQHGSWLELVCQLSRFCVELTCLCRSSFGVLTQSRDLTRGRSWFNLTVKYRVAMP